MKSQTGMEFLRKILDMKVSDGIVTLAVCKECGDVVYDETAGEGKRADRRSEIKKMILHMGLHGYQITFFDKSTGQTIG